MRIKILIIISFLMFGLTGSHAQKENSLALKSFFKAFESAPVKTIEKLYSEASNLKNAGKIAKTQTINTLKNELREAGNFVDYKVTKTTVLSPLKKEVVCLVEYDKKPIKLIFLLHKLNNAWSIQNLKIGKTDFNKKLERKKKKQSIMKV